MQQNRSERPPADRLALHCQATPLGIDEAQPLVIQLLARVVVDDAENLVTGDDLTLSSTAPDGTLVEQTRQVVSKDARNGLLVSTAFAAAFPIGSRASVADRFDVAVYRGDDLEPIEPAPGKHNPLRNLSGDPASPRWYVTQVANLSNLLCAVDAGGPLAPIAATRELADGVDPGMIDHRFYTGYEPDGSRFGAQPLGLAALEEVHEVSLVAIPDLHRVEPDEYAAGHCATVDGRFALLDPPPGSTAESARAFAVSTISPAG